MFNSLASMAQHSAKRTVIFAAVFFVLAGALGGSVAKHLDPYGADDPSTQSVIADNKLEDAGFRDASVIVLIQGVSPTDPAGQARIAKVERQVKTDSDVAGVAGYAETHSPDFLSKDRQSTYLAVSL